MSNTTTATERKDFRFFHRLRVRWAEVDMQKIVFNAHYLMYFDTAIADYWRALALPYEESMHAMGGDLYVRKATVDFRASARIDDVLDVGMRCVRIGNSSIVFEGGLFRQDQFLVGCELVYVFADPATQTSKPVPPALREVLLGYEAGEAMRTIETGDWATLGEAPALCGARCSSRSRTFPNRWSGTSRTPWCCMRSRATGSGRSSPRPGCCRPRTASRTSAAWPCIAICAAAAMAPR